MDVPVSYLKECFSYCENSGLLRWNERTESHFSLNSMACKRWNGRFAGEFAGMAREDGRVVVGLSFNGKKFMLYASRVIWAMSCGRWPEEMIDHINRDRGDNRICNLREATASQNSANRPRRSGRSMQGVRFNGIRYESKIKANQKSIHLGTFDTEIEAHSAYVAARTMLFGDF